MSRVVAKLGFIHRRLWQRDGFYRASVLFGPAPLLGGALAMVVWAGVQSLHGDANRVPGWAIPQSSGRAEIAPPVRTVQPAHPLPAVAADGSLVGFVQGWRVAIQPIDVPATLEVDVKTAVLATFLLDGSSVDMAQIMAHGPRNALYVAVSYGLLVVRTAGSYALSAQLDRSSGPTAHCLTRLGFGSGRILSSVGIDVPGDMSRTFDSTRFDLQPGLYPISWAFGCWHDREVLGPGRMVLMIKHPDEQTLKPVPPAEIVRPTQVRP